MRCNKSHQFYSHIRFTNPKNKINSEGFSVIENNATKKRYFQESYRQKSDSCSSDKKFCKIIQKNTENKFIIIDKDKSCYYKIYHILLKNLAQIL